MFDRQLKNSRLTVHLNDSPSILYLYTQKNTLITSGKLTRQAMSTQSRAVRVTWRTVAYITSGSFAGFAREV